MKMYSDFSHYTDTVATIAHTIPEEMITQALKCLQTAAKKKQAIFVAGNGGSAATSSHMMTDLAKGVFHRGGPAIRIISLADNTSIITAIGNDLGYEHIFSEQLRALGQKGDVLLCISASGNSPNLIEAVKQAQKLSMKVIALVGFDGGKLASMADIVLHAKSTKGDYGPCEDIHSMLMHYFVEKLVESA